MRFLFSLKTPIKPLPHYLSTRLRCSSRFNNLPTSMAIPSPPLAKFVAAVDYEVDWLGFSGSLMGFDDLAADWVDDDLA
nr:hypothetical protein CFP56_72189 [Quercus suber]